jgi:Ca2+-binding RTX toxin-like protein
LRGGAGDDFLDGGDGIDTIEGGAGFDIISFSAAGTGAQVNLTSNTFGGAAGGGDTFTSIEGYELTNQADTFTGGRRERLRRGPGGRRYAERRGRRRRSRRRRGQ